MKIIGNLRPVANKDYIYLMNSNDGKAVKVESWEIHYGTRILKINKKGIFKFDAATAGLKLKIVGKVLNPKTKQLVDFSQEIIPLAGTPKILSLKWQDQDDRDIGTKTVGYLDKVKLEIKTQNIPLGEKLSITIYEDEYKDGHSESSRNMGTYTSSAVNKYGNAFLYFNNIHLYQKKLNDLDYKDESEHEFYARVVYKDQINRIEDGIQLKVKNELIQLIKPPVTNKAVVVQKQDISLKKNDKKKVNVTFNMFFDGTMNNMTNTKSRVAPNSEPNLAGVFNSISNKKDDSYMNFYSNVALLFMNNLIPKNADIISIYTEGIGTVDKQKDQLPPGGIGSSIKIPTTIPFFNIELFKTGIKDKVRRGIALMSEKSSENYFKNKKEIGKVTINVFGFSRGAAAARYFMSQESQIKSVLKLESKADIQFNFIGLFWTFSSS